LTALVPDGQGGALAVWNDQRNVNLGTSQDIYAQRFGPDTTFAWQVNGTPATTALDYQEQAGIAPDGRGGAYIAWRDWRSYPATGETDIYAQHLTATGDVAAGWPATGLPICTDPALQSNVSLLADDSGGAIIVWLDARHGDVVDSVAVYAQHVLSDGSLAPGWVTNGVRLVPGHTNAHVAPDQAGGFYVACSTVDQSYFDLEYIVHRFAFTGARAPGWPADGVRVCGAADDRTGLRVASDGLGGLLLTWFDYRPSPTHSSEIYAARVLPDGSLAPGWTADGVRVSNDTAVGNEFDPVIAPDGIGSAYVAWEWEYSLSPVLIQHLTANGAVATGWQPFGTQVVTTSGQFNPVVSEDGAGGCVVVWEERGGIGSRIGLFAQHFGPEPPVAVRVALVSAVAEVDRVSLVWQMLGGGAADVFRRTESGTWTRIGSPAPDGQDRLRFEDRDVFPGERYAYRLGYLGAGQEQFSADTWVEVPRELELALEGFRPNPAAGTPTVAFSLPQPGAATLEAFDVAGRRVFSRDVGSLGPGRHQLRLEGERLDTGIFYLRLRQGSGTRVARGMIVR
jgi:hypothetical protein